jgi:hypothetical protein
VAALNDNSVVTVLSVGPASAASNVPKDQISVVGLFGVAYTSQSPVDEAQLSQKIEKAGLSIKHIEGELLFVYLSIYKFV